MAAQRNVFRAFYEVNATRAKHLFEGVLPLLEPVKTIKNRIEAIRLTEKFWKLRDRRTEKAKKEFSQTMMPKERGREVYHLYNKRLLGYAEKLVELKAETLKSDCILEEVTAIAMSTNQSALGLKAVRILEKAGDRHLLIRILSYNRTKTEVQNEARAAYARLGGNDL